MESAELSGFQHIIPALGPCSPAALSTEDAFAQEDEMLGSAMLLLSILH